MDYFKASQANLEKIKIDIIKENYLAIILLADGLAAWTEKIPDYFPVGSDLKPSGASSKFWSSFEGFMAAAQLNWEEAISTAKAATINDRDPVITAFRETAEI